MKERLPGYFFKRLLCSATDEWDRISDVIMSLPSTSYVSGAFIFFSRSSESAFCSAQT
ncbi:hypothetical protein HMPREF0670_02150 [Prevotella sp. oral taxon 317 str. F0108]|nr:hypothetical protein HMPREF0670_02150 [Prevotella sp. oral taxon 317 str. F0108]